MDAERPSARGRPRRAETDERIRTAALELLRASGPGAVNIDAVSARSGVARTTIYRRYGSREELMAALLDQLVDVGVPAPSLPVREKLHWLLGSIHDVLEHGIGRGGTAAVLTDSDPEFTDALRARMAEQLRVLGQAMADDVGAGKLSPRVDPDTLVGLLFGAYLDELLRYGDARPGWADRTVALLAPAVTEAPAVTDAPTSTRKRRGTKPR
jgi:AcrR family transcriptional regulator